MSFLRALYLYLLSLVTPKLMLIMLTKSGLVEWDMAKKTLSIDFSSCLLCV